jgi:hypothetical protein
VKAFLLSFSSLYGLRWIISLIYVIELIFTNDQLFFYGLTKILSCLRFFAMFCLASYCWLLIVLSYYSMRFKLPSFSFFTLYSFCSLCSTAHIIFFKVSTSSTSSKFLSFIFPWTFCLSSSRTWSVIWNQSSLFFRL